MKPDIHVRVNGSGGSREDRCAGRATGVSARSLRYYEEQGLLSAGRTVGGQREYPPGVVGRDELITSLLAAGLSTSSIYDVLPCISDAGLRTPALEGRLRSELRRVDDQVRSLRRTREVLADLVSRYSDGPDRPPTGPTPG